MASMPRPNRAAPVLKRDRLLVAGSDGTAGAWVRFAADMPGMLECTPGRRDRVGEVLSQAAAPTQAAVGRTVETWPPFHQFPLARAEAGLPRYWDDIFPIPASRPAS